MKKLTDPEEMAELARLYDIYGELLKDGHREMFADYVLENYSLSEISDERGVTRQAVYDIINRSRAKLREYETKLELLDKLDKIDDELNALEKECETSRAKELIEQIRAELP